MEPTAADWEAGYESAHRRNAETLRPLNEHGHWRRFQTHADRFDGIIVRTIRFTGFENGYRTYAPNDLFIWDESPRPDMTTFDNPHMYKERIAGLTNG